MIAACAACAVTPAAVELATAGTGAQFSVPAIRCAACIGTIERHLDLVPGVRHARVNATKKRVTVQSDLSEDAIVNELRTIGYDAYPLEEDALSDVSDPIGRALILRMGVAGFAMMNVMLLSVAVWSGATDSTRDLFHLISAVIALPAVIFSARPFLDHAFRALKGGRLNMDVPISLAIVLATGMSLYESLNGGEHAYFDAALSLTFFLLIGRYLEHRTKSAARSAASELGALEVYRAERKVGSLVETVDVSDLSIGDTILVPAGMRVPVDGQLKTKHALTDRSFLTGESEPAQYQVGDDLFAGEINLGAPFELTATAIGDDTRLRRIAGLVETAENARNSYTSLADKAAQVYAPVVHILAAATFLGWVMIDGDYRNALNIAIAVLIITCPCALGLAVPAVSTAAISRLYSMGFLIKSGTALERLAEVKSMIFDKTGTLTRPEFSFDLGLLDVEHRSVAKGLAQHSSHPLSKALAQHLHDDAAAEIDCVTEHPGLGVEGVWHGQRVALGRASWFGLQDQNLTLLMHEALFPSPNQETVVPGAEGLSRDLKRQEVTSEIVSGDVMAKTARLAHRIGMESWQSNFSPEEKARYVETRAAEGPICMVGDGINDTAALASASVSIAPGTALDASRNAADIVMIGETLGNLPKVVSVSRKAVKLSKQNFGIAILYNLIAVPIAMAGFATPLIAAIAMSASSITVLINAMRVRI